MNKKRLIAGMLAVSMAILMSSILQASATLYSFTTGSGYTVTPQGNVWKLDTTKAIANSVYSPFPGKDINASTIEATIWHTCPNNLTPHSHTIEPMRVILTDKFIILVFDPKELPDSALSTSVSGEFNNGEDSFFATGPGFVLCFIGC